MIDCLASKVQDQHSKLSPQSHTLLYEVFFDKEHSHSKSPRQIFVAWSPPRKHSFFSDPLLFKTSDWKLCPPSPQPLGGWYCEPATILQWIRRKFLCTLLLFFKCTYFQDKYAKQLATWCIHTQFIFVWSAIPQWWKPWIICNEVFYIAAEFTPWG